MVSAVPMITVTHYTVLGAVLFTLGAVCVLVRRNPVVMFMGVELMLNAVNLTFVAFGRFLNSLDGQVFVFIVLAIAAAEVAVGLALVVAIFRARDNVDVDEIDSLKG